MQRIGPYQVVGELARGGMGVVLRGQAPDGRAVAIKVQSRAGPAAKLSRRFHTEAHVLQRLSHPNLVDVLDVGEEGTVLYLVLELVEGESLADVIERGPLDADRAAEIAQALAEGVQHIHDHGVLHRDIKPANVLISPIGVPVLTDFGLAKDLEASLNGDTTQEGAFIGTPGFLPPEQARGQLGRIGNAADIYGIGATLYAMLTGRPPFDGGSLIEVVAAMHEPPEDPRASRPDLNPALAKVCMGCLEPEPEDRPKSAAALADALRSLGVDVPPPRPPSRGLMVGSALAFAVAAVGAAFALAPPAPPPPEDVADPEFTVAPPGPVTPERPPAPEGDPMIARARANDLVRMAFMDLRDGKTEEALKSLVAATEVNPREPNVWAMRAEVHDKLGQSQEAIDAYGVALANDPAHTLSRYNRAVALQKRGNLEAAVADFREVVRLTPDKLEAWQGLGFTLMGLRREDEAAEAFGEAIRRAPRVADYWYDRARALRATKPRAALADLDAALRIDPKHAHAWFELASLYQDQRDDESALDAYDRAIEANPQLEIALYNRGLMHDEGGNSAKAIADYTAALALNRTARTYTNRAGVHRREKDIDAALKDFNAAIALDPEYVQGWIGRSLVHCTNKDWIQGEADLTVAIRLSPRHPQLHYNRAVARKNTGDIAGAREDLQVALAVIGTENRLSKKCRDLLEGLPKN